jgi:hypothetical protein
MEASSGHIGVSTYLKGLSKLDADMRNAQN